MKFNLWKHLSILLLLIFAANLLSAQLIVRGAKDDDSGHGGLKAFCADRESKSLIIIFDNEYSHDVLLWNLDISIPNNTLDYAEVIEGSDLQSPKTTTILGPHTMRRVLGNDSLVVQFHFLETLNQSMIEVHPFPSFWAAVSCKWGMHEKGRGVDISHSIRFKHCTPNNKNTPLDGLGGELIPYEGTMGNGRIALSDKNTSLRAFPNPFEHHFNVLFNTDRKESAHIKLYDSLGRLVFHRTESTQIGQNYIKVDSAHLPKGVYYLTLEAGGLIQNLKLVK